MSRSSSSTLLLGITLVAAACTPKGGPEPEPTPAKAPPTPDATKPTQLVEPIAAIEPAEPALPVEPASVAESVEPALPAAPLERALVPITPITSTPAIAPWRSVAVPDDALSFVPLAAGVLASSASGSYYQLAEGQLAEGQLVSFELEAPSRAMFGVWPKDVWFIEQTEKAGMSDRGDDGVTELRLMRLRGGDRWVPQEYGGEQRFRDQGQDFRKSSHSGLLVFYDDGFVRVASSTGDPEPGAYFGALVDYLETQSGTIYPISEHGQLTYVQTDCADEACVNAKVHQLPITGHWDVSRQTARQRKSVTALAETSDRSFLIHYESGGWKLEELTPNAVPTGLWATSDGGLWTVSSSLLRHRDPEGAWHDVGLPEGMSGGFSFAISEDRSQIWIAGLQGESTATVVFTTHANAQQPPPAPGE